MDYNGFNAVLNHIDGKKLTKVEPHPWRKTDEGYRLLIVDGHGSHVTGEFLGHSLYSTQDRLIGFTAAYLSLRHNRWMSRFSAR